MAQTVTNRVKAILNTPGTGENVQISELNTNFDKLDNSFVPSAKIYLNTGVTTQTLVNNTATAHDYDNTDHDTYSARAEGAMADLAGNRIVIRKAGIYMLAVSTGWNGNATGVRRLMLFKNAAIIGHIEISPAPAGFVTSIGLATPEVCAVNDAFTVQTIQTSGGPLDVANGTIVKACFLAATWMGASVEV